MMVRSPVLLLVVCTLVACSGPKPAADIELAEAVAAPEGERDLAASPPPVETPAADAAGADHDAVWQPAPTPRGGVSWAVLESTGEITRTGDDGYIRSRRVFPADVRALEGKRITVAGWMMPLENGARQRRFVLLAYPPGCPFHFHALPNQFIEVLASEAVRLDEVNVTTVSGVLELTGEDESGIFYKLRDAGAA